MAAARERGRRDERCRVGESQQRLDVDLAAARDHDGQVVDHFLARELDARDEPPGGRLKPERGAHDLLGDEPGPVAALHVEQLVREHGALNVGRLRAQRVGQQHDRPAHAEGDGVLEMRRHSGSRRACRASPEDPTRERTRQPGAASARRRRSSTRPTAIHSSRATAPATIASAANAAQSIWTDRVARRRGHGLR